MPGNEDAVSDDNMNGHFGSERTEYKKIHGGGGFQVRNEAGERVIDFALMNHMYFMKRKKRIQLKRVK